MTNRYPGGKSGSGVYQRIISQMPPHEVYVEPFLGGGAVMRHKRPARWNYGIDLDGDVVRRAADLAARGDWVLALATPVFPDDCGAAGFEFESGEGISWLRARKSWNRTLVYCDPPYELSTRSSQRRIYRCELEAERLGVLLDVLLGLSAFVMVSGYPGGQCEYRLRGWRSIWYDTMSRGGLRREVLWMNFPEPVELHDYRYLGRDFRERERIRRKEARWVARLSAMTVLERRAVESALMAVRSREVARQDAPGSTISVSGG
jgi:hypothetical protein